MKVIRFLAVVLVLSCGGCVLRYRGQEAVAVDPDLDIWMHHPQQGTNWAQPAER